MVKSQAVFDILDYDILLSIIRQLNMFDFVKVSHINKKYFEMCNQNKEWERHYNNLFDRRIITKESTHKGAMNWMRCRCCPYPGYMSAYDEITNPDHVCRKLDHYENLGTKQVKRKFKNYKERCENKYKSLVMNDNYIKNLKYADVEMEWLVKKKMNIERKMAQKASEIQTLREIQTRFKY